MKQKLTAAAPAAAAAAGVLQLPIAAALRQAWLHHLTSAAQCGMRQMGSLGGLL